MSLGRGKRTREWERVRAELKVAFAAIGLTYCELQYPGCWRDNGLGFAHAKKRRNLKSGELYVAILGCANCHPVLELKPESEMEREVLAIIAKRVCQPRSRKVGS